MPAWVSFNASRALAGDPRNSSENVLSVKRLALNPGSKLPERAYLLPRDTWNEIREGGEPPVAIEADGRAYLEDRERRLHEDLCKLGRLTRDQLEGVRLEKTWTWWVGRRPCWRHPFL